MNFQPSPASDPQPPGLKLPVGPVLAFAGVAAAALLVMPLVVVPFALKSVAPEWSYGRRVGAGIGISLALGAAGGLARALSGKR